MCAWGMTPRRWDHGPLFFYMLVLLAVHHAVLAFQSTLTAKHVLLCTDNTLAACYVNKQEGGADHHCSHGRRKISFSIATPGTYSSPLVMFPAYSTLSRTRSVGLNLSFRRNGPCHTLFCVLSGRWFRPMLDLFATRPILPHGIPRVTSVRSSLRALGASSPLRSLLPDSVRLSTNGIYSRHYIASVGPT